MINCKYRTLVWLLILFRCVAWNFQSHSSNIAAPTSACGMCTNIEISVAAFLSRLPGVPAFIRLSCVSMKRISWKSDISGNYFLPGIVRPETLLYFTLDTYASNSEDSGAFSQCILFATSKFTFASGCWYLMIDFFLIVQFFKEHFASFLMLWAETHVANIIHRNIVLQIFLPVCINKLWGELSTDLSTI